MDDLDANLAVHLIGEILDTHWRRYAKLARESTVPASRGIYGHCAMELCHLAQEIITKVPEFSDCVPTMKARGVVVGR